MFHIGVYPAAKGADVQRWLHDEAYAGVYTHEHWHAHDGEAEHHHHEHDTDHLNVNRHDGRIHAFGIVRGEPVLWKAFAAWIDIMATMR